MDKLILPLRRSLLPSLLVLLTFVVGAHAAEVIPPPPTRYFTDEAHVVSPATVDRLNSELEDLEKRTSNQILVAVYPTMQTDSSVEDYCHRITSSWGVGQKGKDNGAVLFVFIKEHHTWIEVRPGLEGPLPDARCKDITADLIAPKFKAGDYDGGFTAGVEAMIQSVNGENQGNGRTADQDRNRGGSNGVSGISIVIFIVVLIVLCFVFPGFFGVLLNILSLFMGGSTTFGGGSSSGGGWSSGGGGGGGGWSSGGGGGGGGGGGAGSDW